MKGSDDVDEVEEGGSYGDMDEVLGMLQMALLMIDGVKKRRGPDCGGAEGSLYMVREREGGWPCAKVLSSAVGVCAQEAAARVGEGVGIRKFRRG